MQGRDEHTGFWWGNLWKRGHLEKMGVDGRMILEWISQKAAERAWTESRVVAGSCEHGNEISGCIKCGEFLD
jgi:hypothetical protein